MDLRYYRCCNGILRPGQEMKSFLTDFKDVLDEEFKIEMSWKCVPNAKMRELINYHHLLPVGISRLGAWSPEMRLAESLKHVWEDWQQAAKGQRKLKIDNPDSV